MTLVTEAKDASVSECTWTLSALEALRNALYKFKTYKSRTGRTEYQLLLMKASDRGRNVKFLGNNFGCVLSKLSNRYQVQFHYDQDKTIVDVINNINESQSCRMIFTKSKLILI